MMTFRFTGAVGQMTDPEPLTSGMVGKEVWIEFDDAWTDLSKTVVFTAGDVTRQELMSHNAMAIPAEVLATPWRRLQVGVLGTDGDGLVVLPSQMVMGPLITKGATPGDDPLYGG